MKINSSIYCSPALGENNNTKKRKLEERVGGKKGANYELGILKAIFRRYFRSKRDDDDDERFVIIRGGNVSITSYKKALFIHHTMRTCHAIEFGGRRGQWGAL